ncbi:hypothetical protein AgCh_001525 [Apium graveolens]
MKQRGSRVTQLEKKAIQGESKEIINRKQIHTGQQIHTEPTDATQSNLEKANKVSRYWFLLDKEIVKAISKGNFKLLSMARARVDFLLTILDPAMVERGLNGEEEVIWEIHKYLHNNGWWVRADNLIVKEMSFPGDVPNEELKKSDQLLLSFIDQNRNLVHPNTLKTLNISDNETIRMALNQIHYGSLRDTRERKDFLNSGEKR